MFVVNLLALSSIHLSSTIFYFLGFEIDTFCTQCQLNNLNQILNNNCNYTLRSNDEKI